MSAKIIEFENKLVGDSCYLSCFDPYVQRALGLSYQFVRRRLYVQCLMNERIFTSISHILASAISSRLLKENTLLLEGEIVIPYSREYHSVKGIVKDRVSRYQQDAELYRKWDIPISGNAYLSQIFNAFPGHMTEDVRRIAENKVEFLDSKLKSVVSHSPLPGMQTFKKELLFDLRDSGKSSQLEMRTFIGRLADFIDESVSDRMNRDLYFAILNKYGIPARERIQLVNILNFNYHVGYLSNLRWQPVLDAPWLEEIYEERFDKKPYIAKKMAILGKASAKALEELIQVSSVPTDYLDRLTAEDIVKLRANSCLRSFRYQVKQIILSLLFPTSEELQEYLLKQAARLAKEVVRLIIEQARSEARSLSRIVRIHNFVMCIFAAGFSYLHPALLILLVPPAIDTLVERGPTYQLLMRTHKYDLAFLMRELERLWMPRFQI